MAFALIEGHPPHTDDMTRPATAKQQEYLDRAAYYVGRARICCGHEMWPEAATHFGSALESLLRIRFGSKPKLAELVDRFDKDSLFSSIGIHQGSTKKCATCVADHTRTMRNAVHPDCWKLAIKKDADLAACLVMLIYHVMVVCSTKVAFFQDSPDATLSRMEAEGIYAESTHPHEG